MKSPHWDTVILEQGLADVHHNSVQILVYKVN